MPLVSIITPLFNGADYISDCLRSVAMQTIEDYEHIIIDNQSTDDGVDIVARAAATDSRIRLLRNDKSRGAGPTRNVGIEAANGKYIAFLDCDDQWRPEKLERQISEMDARGLAFSWTSYQVIDAAGAPVRVQHADQAVSYETLLYKRSVIGCLTCIYDASLIGKHYMSVRDLPEDFCLWLDILRTSHREGLQTAGIDACLADYRVHGKGSSANKINAAKMQWRAYRQHVGLGRLQTLHCFFSYATRAVIIRIKCRIGVS